jgi:hypothetical protein
MRYALAFLALLVLAVPASAQTIGDRYPQIRPLCDSIPRIQTRRAVDTQLRNRLRDRCSAIAASPLVVDTLYLPPPPDSTPTVPPDPPTGEVWDSVLVGAYASDIVVPAGKRWLLKNVQVRGNVRCTESGVLAMRPGSSLVFVGADPLAYIGGGLQFAPEFANDVGLWVSGSCALDFRGTPKTAWNQTGQASDWSSTDELWSAPVELGDFQAHRYTLGAPVPRADPLTPPAEVLNVTRDCVITGPGHIHIHTTVPQRVDYCALVNLGIMGPLGPVMGRYALHLHFSGDGSRGSVFRGIVCRGGGTCFVPHASHGTTWVDNIVLDALGNGFWWDQSDETNDVSVDHMAVVGVGIDGFLLGAGVNMSVCNSVAVGARGNDQSVGFEWPEPTPIFDGKPLVWRFDCGNIAHNNLGPGIRFWNNTDHPHVVDRYTSYRNQGGGIENGAYVNLNVYRNVRSFEDGYGPWYGGFLHAAVTWNSNSGSVGDGRTAVLENTVIVAKEGPALTIGHRQLPAASNMLIQNVTLTAGPGQPKVFLTDATHPWMARFSKTNVTPSDVVFETLLGGNEGSRIEFDPDGDGIWNTLLTITNGQRKVETR